jgi:hypothetical protein
MSLRKRSSAGIPASRNSDTKARMKARIGAPQEIAIVAVRPSGRRSQASETSETPWTMAASSGSSTIQRSSGSACPSTT